MQQKNKYIRIQEFLKQNKFPNYRMKQITNAIFPGRINNFNEITVLPKSLRDMLIEEFGESILNIVPLKAQQSTQVSKVLFGISGDEKIETVNMKYKAGWESFCISSQCGCNFGCKFCATGDIGLKRNLTSDEITDQILYFHLQGHSIDSISFMGMGEPFANPNLFEALDILTSSELFGLSQRKITISTIGIIPGIKRVTEQYPQINLAYSLHAPTNRLRSSLMPISKTYSLDMVLDVLDEHIKKTNRKVFLAYIMLDGINARDEHAIQLAKLLRKHKKVLPLYHLDLIPYNETKVSMRFVSSSRTRINEFCKVLHGEGIHANIRTQFGSDINAACGQLAGTYKNETTN